MTDWTKGIPDPDEPTSDEQSSSDAEAGATSKPTPLRPRNDGVDWTAMAADTPEPDAEQAPAREAMDWTAASSAAPADPSAAAAKPAPPKRKNPAGKKTPKKKSTGSLLKAVAAILGTGIVLSGGAVVVADRVMNTAEEDTTAAAPAAETSVEPTESEPAETTSAAPTTATPDQKSIGGTCDYVESTDLPVTRAGQKDLRAAWVTYNVELYSENAKGVEAVLSGDSSMRGQDWDYAFDSIDADSVFCLEMQPVDGRSVEGRLEVTTPDGESIGYSQRATGVKVDGRWFIKDITSAE